MLKSLLKKIKKLKIDYRLRASGFQLEIFDKGQYAVKYPLKIFRLTPSAVRSFILDNFIYSRTRPLAFYTQDYLVYRTKQPFFKNFIDRGILQDLSCIADLNHLSTGRLKKDFQRSERRLIFKQGAAIKHLPDLKSLSQRAVLALSFGKDSLLSYGLAKELGLDYLLVTGNEMENESGDEWKIKSAIMEKFCQQEQEKVYLFSDNVDEMFYHPRFKVHLQEMDDTNSMLAYVLELLPFVYFHRARYLILGNERNLNDFFVSREGYKVYPANDQSAAYTTAENKYWRELTNNSFAVISFLEPLYNLAEMKILYYRYPHLLKYLMSCAPDKGSSDRWCYHCPMCAKAFLYSAAVGGDPRKIAFNRNFFEKKYAELYPLFTRKKLRHYERPPQVKEEQILSFLLCFKAGLKGALIDLFKKKYLSQALRQEDTLRKKYFGIHQSVNLPVKFKSQVLKIFSQELKNLS